MINPDRKSWWKKFQANFPSATIPAECVNYITQKHNPVMSPPNRPINFVFCL